MGSNNTKKTKTTKTTKTGNNLGNKEHRISIFDKAKMLEEFCKNNSELWFIRRNGKQVNKYLSGIKNEYDRDELLKQLKVAEDYYEYICRRITKGKKYEIKMLSKEDIIRLKEAGIGGVFGYKKEIEDLAEKYKKVGLSDQEVQDENCVNEHKEKLKKIFYALDMKYGGLNNFRTAYINSLIDGKPIKIPKEIQILLVRKFDLNSPNFINSSRGFNNLYDALYGKNTLIFDNLITQVLLKRPDIINIRKLSIIDLMYGFNSAPKTSKQIGSIMGISAQRIVELKKEVLTSLRNNMDYSIEVINSVKREFAIEFFKHHDIFIDDNELDENVKKKLLDIINMRILQEDVKKINPYAKLNESDFNRLLEVVNAKVINSGYVYLGQIPEKDRYNLIIIEASIHTDTISIYKELTTNKIELKKLPINYLRLPYEIIRILRENRIDTVAKLIRNTEKELIIIGIDRENSLSIIKQELSKLGLHLKEKEHEEQKSIIIINPKLLVPIEELNFEPKIYYALKRHGFEIVADLYGKSEYELTGVKGIWHQSYINICDKLKKFLGTDKEVELQGTIEKLLESFNKAKNKEIQINQLLNNILVELEKIKNAMQTEGQLSPIKKEQLSSLKKELIRQLDELNIKLNKKKGFLKDIQGEFEH